jgi:hypothetical protein
MSARRDGRWKCGRGKMMRLSCSTPCVCVPRQWIIKTQNPNFAATTYVLCTRLLLSKTSGQRERFFHNQNITHTQLFNNARSNTSAIQLQITDPLNSKDEDDKSTVELVIHLKWKLERARTNLSVGLLSGSGTGEHNTQRGTYNMLTTTGKKFFFTVYYEEREILQRYRRSRDVRGGCVITRVESKAVGNRLPACVSRGRLVWSVSFFLPSFFSFWVFCLLFELLRTRARVRTPPAGNKAPAAPAF